MKNVLFFSLLLLSLAITAGCSSSGSSGGDTTPALTYQTPLAGPPIILPGESATLRFWGKNTEAVLPDFSDKGYTLFKTGRYDVTFWAQKEGVKLNPGPYPLTVSAKDGNDKATATVYVIPDINIEGRVEGKPFKLKPSKPGEPSEQTFALVAADPASAESFGAAGTTYKWELKLDNSDKPIGEFTTSDNGISVLFQASETVTGSGQVCVVMKDGLSGITLPEICARIKVGKGGNAKPDELEGFWTFDFGPSGLWGDRDRAAEPPNALEPKDIPDRAYVYWAFGIDIPDSIDGYEKIVITDDDYSVLKAGQWSTAIGDWGIEYVVIVPKLTPPDELEGFWTFDFGPSGLWGDRDRAAVPPNALEPKDIPDRAYVYWAFGIDIPDPIEGYEKVVITDDDYSVLKAGQWSTAIGDWGIEYVVIVLHDFVP